ncbi:histone deacetylase [Wallemia mellicola]|uniref:Histone deacetylase n=1 Tax=Wallemia mellicola TaxID=1708541 RepID=A0A4T0SAE7_9BASI|nr:hypothetical protein E3Q24_02719 [Wallemia mellicola]TIB76019.1 hypothetical protein E3Q23_02060 [Wallemia mellicola]TIB77582.1 histone deacetylase [Wallemia mellicola]TIB84569.1 histone deacetylase [Wallemia mellicola]TIB87820.1 histone deacetylase [Wallemia mellicola]
MTTESKKLKSKVAYYYDSDVGNYSYGFGHPMKPHRMRMVHNLVLNYGLDKKMQILKPPRASPEEMTRFHTDEYIDFLKHVTPETAADLTRNHEICQSLYFLCNFSNSLSVLSGEDCPSFEGLFEFCSISAGGSIAAANRLTSGESDISVNWAGGLHHAKKREASGFCYVNDIVLAIIELLRYHQRVLYIDIDIHHGDGVEEAFYTTDRVLTCSFHKYPDYFPGTGSTDDTGMFKGKSYSVNFPLRDGIDDESYHSVFRPTIQHIMEWYRPGAVVLQCGADSLAGDKLGVFNLSMKGHADCVKFVKAFNLPMIVLGGGGYAVRNVSRTWTYETGLLVDKHLEEDLPFNDYLDYYGPRYKLDVPETNMENHNTPEYLHDIQTKVFEHLKELPFAPSAQIREVPSDPWPYSDQSDDELDERISKAANNIYDEPEMEEDDYQSTYKNRSNRINGRNRTQNFSKKKRRFFQSAQTSNNFNNFGCGHEHTSKPQLDDFLRQIVGSSASTNTLNNQLNERISPEYNM